MKNKLLANYLRSSGNELATVLISAFYIAVLSNNSLFAKIVIFSKVENISQFFLFIWTLIYNVNSIFFVLLFA
ncbi:hypothetical protein DXD58_09990 [Bacteroides sp. D20]|uniref:Uncharacterized protein n=1 Tax=Phocaeicola vulgatus TaxID=821 RepID=A0A415DPH0_PHOVU|nr:hypothetical protein DXD58_09990 [Bacteroides sp. D20]RHJ80331.1 hypothetical protein DW105_01745 [Phocaeicola vulgatus]